MQQNYAIVGQIWRYVQKRQKPSRQEREQMSHKAMVMLRQWDQMYLENDILYQRVIDPHQGQLKQLVLSEKLQPLVLEMLYQQAGHQGIERTTHLIIFRFYWACFTISMNIVNNASVATLIKCLHEGYMFI